MTGRFSHPIRSIALLTGWILPFAIGVSRLEIRVHSVSEVISGLILGYLASALFLRLQRNKARPHLSWPHFAIALALPLALMGQRQPAPTQGLLEHIAKTLAQIERPYTRADLHNPTRIP